MDVKLIIARPKSFPWSIKQQTIFSTLINIAFGEGGGGG